MPPEIPNTQEQPQKPEAERSLATSPSAMAKDRMAKAEERIAGMQAQLEKTHQMQSKPQETSGAPKDSVDKGQQRLAFVNALHADTVSVLDSRISLIEKQRDMAKQEMKESSLGKTMNSVFTLGGLVGTSVRDSEQQALDQSEKVLAGLQKEKQTLQAAASMQPDAKLKTTLALRSKLGVVDVPRDLGEKYLGRDYDTFAKNALTAVDEKDSDLSMDYAKINEALEATEAVFDTWETSFEIGAAVAMTAATGGAGPLANLAAQLSLSVTTEASRVYRNEKSIEQAAQDAVISAIGNALGAKIAKSLGKLLQGGAKATKFDVVLKKAADMMGKLVKSPAIRGQAEKITGKVARNALEGATSGGIEGSAHSVANTAKEKGAESLLEGKTYTDAAAKGLDSSVAGAAGGAVMGTGMEYVNGGIKNLRSRKVVDAPTVKSQIAESPALQEQRARNLAIRSPQERVAAAEGIVKRKLTASEGNAITAAHDVPMTGVDANGNPEYSITDLAQKTRILRKAGLSKDQSDALLRMGVCGNIPPPPPPPGKKPTEAPKATVPSARKQPTPSAPDQPTAAQAPSSSPVRLANGMAAPPPPPAIRNNPVNQAAQPNTASNDAANASPKVKIKPVNAPSPSAQTDSLVERTGDRKQIIMDVRRTVPFMNENNRIQQFQNRDGQKVTIAWEVAIDMNRQELLNTRTDLRDKKLEQYRFSDRKLFDNESTYGKLQKPSSPDHPLLLKFEEYTADMLLDAQKTAKKLGIQWEMEGIIIEKRPNFEAGIGKFIKMPDEALKVFVDATKAGDTNKLKEYREFLVSRVVHEMTHKTRFGIDQEHDEIATHALQFLATDGKSRFLNSQLTEGVNGAAKGSKDEYDVAQNAAMKLIYLSLKEASKHGMCKEPPSYRPDDISSSFATMSPENSAKLRESVGKNIVGQKAESLLARASRVANLPVHSPLVENKKFRSQPHFRDAKGKPLPIGDYRMEKQNNRWVARATNGSIVEPLLDEMPVRLTSPGKSLAGADIPAGEYTFVYRFDKTTCEYAPALRPKDNSAPYGIDFSKTKIAPGS